MILSLVLAAVAVPAPTCAGDRVVVAPFEPLAISPADARAVEEKFRSALDALGFCVEARGATIAKLRRYEHTRLPPCADDVCAVAQAVDLGGKWLLTGVVLGVG